MNEQNLRSQLIRLAHTKPELRSHLLPLVASTRKALYPSSPKGARPLDSRTEEDVWNAGYEAASYYASKGLTRMDGDDLFINAIHEIKDARIPRNINESDLQFWEYLGTFIDGAKAFAGNHRDFVVRTAAKVDFSYQEILHNVNLTKLVRALLDDDGDDWYKTKLLMMDYMPRDMAGFITDQWEDSRPGPDPNEWAYKRFLTDMIQKYRKIHPMS